jgi:hypothetical protein
MGTLPLQPCTGCLPGAIRRARCFLEVRYVDHQAGACPGRRGGGSSATTTPPNRSAPGPGRPTTAPAITTSAAWWWPRAGASTCDGLTVRRDHTRHWSGSMLRTWRSWQEAKPDSSPATPSLRSTSLTGAGNSRGFRRPRRRCAPWTPDVAARSARCARTGTPARGRVTGRTAVRGRPLPPRQLPWPGPQPRKAKESRQPGRSAGESGRSPGGQGMDQPPPPSRSAWPFRVTGDRRARWCHQRDGWARQLRQ